MARKKNVLSIAVVIKTSTEPVGSLAEWAASLLSQRALGDWASFVGPRTEVIDRALKARDKWEASNNGPHRIFVGELKSEIVVPREYREVPL